MHPTPRWKTHKGDDWWYEAGGVRASASFIESSSAVSIDHITGLSGPESLRKLLVDTVRQFPGIEPRVPVTASTKPLLHDLSSRDIIRWEPLQHPLSVEARVTFVVV